MANADGAVLDRLIEAVTNRTPVSWSDELRGASPALARKIRSLRAVESIDRLGASNLHTATATATVTDSQLAPGVGVKSQDWGPLKIVEELGRGGFGDVFRAYDPALKSEVALKLLRKSSGSDDGAIPVLAEAQALARVRHPNVLTVHGAATHDGVAGIWTELLEGVTLEESLSNQGPYSAHEAALVGVDLCRAVAAVHKVGLIHRDIKTANVMRERGGRIVLLDFSIGSEASNPGNKIAGTLPYMAPELLAGQDSGIAIDIYALGVLLYRLVSCKYPVTTEVAGAPDDAQAPRQTVPLLDVRPDVPSGFARIVERALSVDPASRYPSAGEMERDLSQLVGGAAPVAERQTPRRTTRSTRLIAGTLATIALAVSAFWIIQSWYAPLSVNADWIRLGSLGHEQLESGSALLPGDCLGVRVRGNRPMHLYVLNEDSNGATSVLFPLDGLAAKNPLSPGADRLLPGTIDGNAECWRIGDGVGAETMLIVASLSPLKELEESLRDLPRVERIFRGPEERETRGPRGVVGLSSVPGTDLNSRLSRTIQSLSREAEDRKDLWMSQVRFVGADSKGLPSSNTPSLERLERLAEQEPADPDALLALSRALTGDRDRPESFRNHVRAYELAARVFELRPQDPASCRRKAETLHQLFLSQRAAEVLQTCIPLTADESHRESIRRRLTEISPQAPDESWNTARGRLDGMLERGEGQAAGSLASLFPHRVRAQLESEWIPHWAERYRSAKFESAARMATVLSVLGETVRTTAGDSLALDAARRIEKLTNQNDREQLARLADAHLAFLEADRLVTARACSDAEPRLADAADGFRNAGSPFSYKADLRRAVCRYYSNDYETAAAILRALADDPALSAYPSILGNVHQMIGLNAGRRSDYRTGANHLLKAASQFDAIGDRAQLAVVKNLEAQTYDALGSLELAWTHRHGSLAGLDSLTDPRQFVQIAFNAAVAAGQQGFPRFAVELGTLAARSAEDSKDAPAYIAMNLRLSEFLDDLGEEGASMAAQDAARAWLPRLPVEAREELEAELAISDSRRMLRSDADAAARYLDAAIRFYENGSQERLASLYPMRGRAFLEAGQTERAEADFEAGIETFERRRFSVEGERSRISYADLASRVYDEMIRFQVMANRSAEAALNFAERGRARVLQDYSESERKEGPLRVAEIAPGIPADTILVYYSVLDDRLLIWSISDGSVNLVERAVSRDALVAMVGSFRRQILQARSTSFDLTHASSLYLHLIDPILERAEGKETIVFVPDKALHLVPFSALVNPGSGRFLVQDFALAVTPSAALLLRQAPDNKEMEGDELDALIVGDPAFDRQRFRELGDLPGAQNEARTLARDYERSELLLGTAATKSAVLSRLHNFRIVHFSGHAVLNDSDPTLSLLALAPDRQTGDTGELPASELFRPDPGRIRMVVLAACSTGTGFVSSAEGPVSLARPFLASGIPAVVATLWQIDDLASSQLFVRFHDRFRQSRSPSKALREAQLEFIDSPDPILRHPRSWAAVRVFLGSGSSRKGDV